MLGDEDRHADPPRQRLEQAAERVDAAGRGADREQVDRSADIAPKRRVGRSGRAARRRQACVVGIAERLELARAGSSEKRPLKRPVPGLGNVSAAPSASAATVCSAPSSASDETIMILRAAGRGDDPRDRLEPARPGHFEVEQDDVDAHRLERVDRVFGGPGNRGDLERVVAFDHARQHRAGDHRIVDDHQADAAIALRRSRLAVPRYWRAPAPRPRSQATPTS